MFPSDTIEGEEKWVSKMAVEESINVRLQAIAGVTALGSTGKNRGRRTSDGNDRKLLLVNEGEKVRRDSLREGNELVVKEGKVAERAFKRKGEGVEEVLERKAFRGEGVEKRRSKTTGREVAARTSPHSRSARRRSRWHDDGNDGVEKKIASDLKAESDALFPIIGEIEKLIGKGRAETEKTAAVPSLDKSDGSTVKKPFFISATPQPSKCDNSGKNHQREFVKNGKCEVNLKHSEAATVNSPPVFSQQERTAFVLGLPWEVEAHDLKEYFGRFGEVESAKVASDHATGLSRGFAFLVFKDMSARMDATAQGEHVMKGKKVKCRWAGPGWKEIKIRVENLPSKGLSDEELADHFSQFGPVADVIRPLDELNNTQQFCFVVFDKEETGLKLIEQGCSTINGQKIIIKSVSITAKHEL